MAQATPRGSRARRQRDEEHEQAIEAFFKEGALSWLALPNVVGVMLGKKRVADRKTDRDAIIFRVERKLAERPDILAIGSKPFPEEITVGGRRYLTDVLEGAHRANDGAGAAFDPRQHSQSSAPASASAMPASRATSGLELPS